MAELIEELDLAVGLLEVARCPNENCMEGTIPHQVDENEWEPEQCQWCHERDQLIKKKTECKHGELLSGCCNACADSGIDPRKGHYIGLDRNKS